MKWVQTFSFSFSLFLYSMHKHKLAGTIDFCFCFSGLVKSDPISVFHPIIIIWSLFILVYTLVTILEKVLGKLQSWAQKSLSVVSLSTRICGAPTLPTGESKKYFNGNNAINQHYIPWGGKSVRRTCKWKSESVTFVLNFLLHFICSGTKEQIKLNQ